MKILHFYLTRQILASLILTVMVFTFVLLIGNVLKDIVSMIMNGQVGFGAVAKAIGLLVPFAWMFALPMGMLTATLLVFGRFSADQELTAVRASGVSLLALVSPILLLSIVLCGVCAVVNLELGPRCRVAFTTMRFNLGVQLSASLLPEGRFITDYPGLVLYVGENRSGNLKDVIILMFDNKTNLERTITAQRGRMVLRSAEKQVDITLFAAKTIEANGVTGLADEFPVTINQDSPQKAFQEPKIDDMTYWQLWRELHNLEQRVRLPVTLKNLSPEQLKQRKAQLEEQRKDLETPILFQIHRQVAYSFACFGFTLLGIPLGIRVQRRETNIGIAIALILVAVYYSFIVVGKALQNRPEFLPYIIVWIPNFLFQTVGAVLLWRANKGI